MTNDPIHDDFVTLHGRMVVGGHAEGEASRLQVRVGPEVTFLVPARAPT